MSQHTHEFAADWNENPEAPVDNRSALALLIGVAAALASGVMWAGLVFLTDMEVGWAAWGIGLLVGFAMSRTTANRSQRLAYAAAMFAVIGLLAGKAFIFTGSADRIVKELEQNDEYLSGAVAWQMHDNRQLDEATMLELDALGASDTVPDVLWASMRAQGAAKLANMSLDQRHRAAVKASTNYMESVGIVGGIRAQLSLFDLLWLFLAVGTAYRMMAPPKVTPVVEQAASV